jgi:hypothetical protein
LQTKASFHRLIGQYYPEVDSDAAGNYVVVWEATNANGWGSTEIYAQRYNREGTPIGPEFQVNTDRAGDQYHPHLAVADDGTFAVTWTTSNDGAGTGIQARIFHADGSPQTGVFPVNTTTVGDQHRPEIAMNPTTGNFVVVWTSSQETSSLGVFAQRFLADGTPVGGEFQVNSYTSNEQSNPDVAMDENGNFVVAWRSYGQDGNNWGVFAQRYAADGLPQRSSR